MLHIFHSRLRCRTQKSRVLLSFLWDGDKHSSQHDFSSEWREDDWLCDASWARSAAQWPVLTCNVTLKGIRGKADSWMEHARSHRAAPLAARYAALTSECSCYITMFCYKSVVGFTQYRRRFGTNFIFIFRCFVVSNSQIKGKICPCAPFLEEVWGNGGITPLFSTSTLDRGGWSALRPGSLPPPPENSPYTYFIGGWVGPSAGLYAMEERTISYPCRQTSIPRSSSP
jgi:hypothetical protein